MCTNNGIIADEDVLGTDVETWANTGLTTYRDAGQDLDGFLPNFQGP